MPEEQSTVDALLRLLSRAERLEALPRTGWLVCGVNAPESIAAHSYATTLVAMWIADHLEEPVDVAQVLRIALLHDVSESLLTDLPAPVKRRIGREHVREAERQAAEDVLGQAPPSWQEAVQAYAAKDSLEARIVKAADRIQMLAKALQYERQRRGDVARFFDGPDPDFKIPLVARILARIRRHREEGTWFVSDFD